MTLKEALDTIAKYCTEHACSVCPLVMAEKPDWGWRRCKLQANVPEDYDKIEVEK
jgi:hypothetical protein